MAMMCDKANIIWEKALTQCAEANQKTCSSSWQCVSPKELSLLQAVGVISMKHIKIIRQEVCANEEAILVFLVGSKLNGEIGTNGKEGGREG